MLQRQLHRGLLLAATVVFALGPAAHAFQRVTLRNGFSYDCAQQQPLADGRVRLFLSAASTGYIDLPAAEIVSIATLPDPPAPSAAPATTDVHALLARAGAEHDIDVELLASIVHAESGGRAHAVSHAGAQGLMQLMPQTARTLGVHDSFQPDQNINGGAAYLDALLTRYNNNLALALAAYNAGPAAVDRFHGIPPYRETRAYVARVMTEFKRRKLQLAQNAINQNATSSLAANNTLASR
jgi:soluble lytic murein transglycosylase-like protein